MKIKTAEATGLQLDWGVATVMRLEPELAFHECYRYGVVVLARPSLKSVKGLKEGFSHADPAVCMGLMSQHETDVTWGTSGKAFVQMSGSDDDEWHGGKTLTEAVARCVIAMRLGDEFEVPDELGVMS